jgi:hypothetical protein
MNSSIVKVIRFSPDGKYVFTADFGLKDKLVHVYSIDGKECGNTKTGGEPILDAACGKDFFVLTNKHGLIYFTNRLKNDKILGIETY